ncbi:extracellular solute-binding protein [Streptomyces sp. NPDC088725]|uniref:extracellular solute-binding protein n=1 Tax=Streptomyces sp. NPDC088725 TaxID=3365873 RepID=UPI0038088C1B
MKLSARTATPAAALVLAWLTLTGCAPGTSDTGATKDEQSGTLRVWLFQEVDNKPKEQVVDAVVAAFRAEHKGTKVATEYIPVETRAQRVKAAFNDPRSAPDLIEYGNTDTAGYVKDGGLAEIGAEFDAWDEAKDTDPAARRSVTVGGGIYGAPLFVGVRALYYRTDVFKELGIAAPRSQAELISTARKIHRAKPDLYGLAVGGAYTYGALPFVWANGGELAEESGGTYKAAVNSPAARAGIAAYTSLFGDDNCPAAKCASMGGVLDEILTDGITEREVARARAMTKGIHAREREDSASHARLLALELFRRDRFTGQRTESALLDTLTADEIVDVARQALSPEAGRCTAVGPETARSELPGVGHEWVLSQPR